MATFSKSVVAETVDSDLGLVIGWAIVCTENGQPYFDVQGHHIPEDEMLKASSAFMKSGRVAKHMHSGEQQGVVVHSFPLTTEVAKRMGIQTNKTGWMVGMAPYPELLAKFKSGELKGFSIGGEHGTLEPVNA